MTRAFQLFGHYEGLTFVGPQRPDRISQIKLPRFGDLSRKPGPILCSIVASNAVGAIVIIIDIMKLTLLTEGAQEIERWIDQSHRAACELAGNRYDAGPCRRRLACPSACIKSIVRGIRKEADINKNRIGVECYIGNPLMVRDCARTDCGSRR